MAMTEEQYRRLKATIYVLRASGAPLSAEQKADVNKWELAVAEYENKLKAASAR